MQAQEISVNANKIVADVSPTMWGVFFEDINFAADGGLYAELVKNRSFEFSIPLMGWKQFRQEGDGRVLPTFYSPANPANSHFIQIVVNAPSGSFGIVNEGFRGIGIKKDEQYNFSVYVKIVSNAALKMKIELINPAGVVIGNSELSGFTAEWKKYQVSLYATQTEQKAQLRLLFTGKGTIDIDMVSLFPADTWKNRPGGLRKDLVQMIADLKPGFIRFPGGCIVEGRDLTNRYQWKKTTGPVEERKLIINRWNVEMQNRQAPDYFQSFGLGFFEYFQLAEDIGAEPLPILNCGMSCQFNAGEVVPLNDLNPYIQDALDLIEFANGDISTKWGKLRYTMGHAKPFNLKFIGIGNEQWDEQYIERYKEFEKVIKTKYPKIKIVAGSGLGASGKLFDYAWSELKKLSPDLIDEHYYMPPEWFLQNAGRYDNYDRKGIKVFAGEYAAHGKEADKPESRNSWHSALAEAAFMTGLERNADVVNMTSYAPLFAHVEAWQWRPDLIWFDNLNSIGSPNYYVQKIFSTYKGTQVIQVHAGGKPLKGQDSLYASASIDKNAGKVFLKIVNAAKSVKYLRFNLEGQTFSPDGVLVTLKSAGLYDYNSMSDPQHIFPTGKSVTVEGKKINQYLDPISVNVIILTFRK
ncbi:MAG: alpha-L-arabinofuranosidase [Odoribacter sp.]|nr:alpha-L-arabinofuranosidase [Odoribacter sp.]